MLEKLRDYYVVSRYLVAGEGWKTETVEVPNATFSMAGAKASSAARVLDATFYDSHFWTVTIRNAEGQDYIQLFHGRLS